MRGSDLLAEMLVHEGVDTMFTLMSEEITSFTSTLRTRWDDEVDVVQTRHEQSAIAMADGYARTGGEIGVAAVGRGPAIAQTGTALVTAQKSGSNVLVVVPERPRAATVDHLNKEFRQQSYLETLVDTVLSVQSEDALVPKLADAFFRLYNGDGPVVVQIPWDLLDAEIDGAGDWQRKLDETRQRTASDARLHPERAGIREAVDLLVDTGGAAPPVVLVGRGAVRAGAGEAIAELAERLGAPLATTLRARGYFSGHPLSVGIAGNFGDERANRRLREAEFVLAVGCSLNPHTTDDGRSLADATVVHVDVDPGRIGRYTPVALGVVGDARVSAEAFREEVERRDIDLPTTSGEGTGRPVDDARGSSETSGSSETPGSSDASETASTRMHPRELMRALDSVLPEDRLVVTDSGQATGWVINGIAVRRPEDYVWPMEFGTIGLAHPFAQGAANTDDDRLVVAFCGDAGFLMSLQELDTAVRRELSLVVVVVDDEALGAEYQQLITKDEHAPAAAIPTPDLASIADGFGAEGYTVGTTDDLERVADRLGPDTDGPVVLDCEVDREARHPFFDRGSE